MNQLSDEDLKKAGKDYSEEDLFSKILKFAGKAGKEVIYYVLLLYYSLKSPKVSIADKVIITGALGYFICPIDLVADIIPIVGFTDDLGALLLALAKISNCLNKDIVEEAVEKLKEWFDVSEDEIEIFNSKFQQ